MLPSLHHKLYWKSKKKHEFDTINSHNKNNNQIIGSNIKIKQNVSGKLNTEVTIFKQKSYIFTNLFTFIVNQFNLLSGSRIFKIIYHVNDMEVVEHEKSIFQTIF